MNNKPCKNCGSYGGNVGCDVCGPPIRERIAQERLARTTCSACGSRAEPRFMKGISGRYICPDCGGETQPINQYQIVWDEAAAACQPGDATTESFHGNMVVQSLNGLRQQLDEAVYILDKVCHLTSEELGAGGMTGKVDLLKAYAAAESVICNRKSLPNAKTEGPAA